MHSTPELPHTLIIIFSQQVLWWLLQCCLQFLEQSWSYVVLFCPSYVTDIDVGNQNIPLYPIQNHHCDHLMFGTDSLLSCV